MTAGILCLDKPAGPSSHTAVAAVRRALATRRVGHFGTLDPFATGLLVCAVGPATRLAAFGVRHGKTYQALVRLGSRSTTDDPEGELTPVPGAAPPTAAAVSAACAAWIGTVQQTPPAYSAVHIGGVRAYARARAGEAVAPPARSVTFERIEIVRYAWPDLELEIACGPGTYIRSLARDLGEALGTGGYCAALRRTRSGPFTIDDALPWAALTDPAATRAALRPSDEAVADLPEVALDPAGLAAIGRGQRIAVPAGLSPAARWVRLAGPAGFVGIAEQRVAGDVSELQPRVVLFPAGERAP